LQVEAAIIRHHHERLDGRGYPDGLKGDVIPLEARILAVADALDAMTCPRPHRGALSFKDALDQLRAGAAQQFDPKVVEAALAAQNELAGSEEPSAVAAAAAAD
jgi:HD-GYP domain-containing protein (c-di-GMP phosphodiesterase class II)